MRYVYGSVSGTRTALTVVTERVDPVYVCCGYASAQMVARTAKAGISALLRNEGHKMRAAGGRPHNAGSNAGELIAGANSLGVRLSTVEVSGIRGRLASGFAVTASIHYERLPDYLRVQQNAFGHDVCLYGYRKKDGVEYVGFLDPLWTQGAKGAWARWVDIDQALWPDFGHTTSTTRLGTVVTAPSGGSDVSINTGGLGLTSKKKVKITRGTRIFTGASGSASIATAKEGYAYPYIGNPYGSSRFAALINTGIIYSDKIVRPTVLYVNKADAVIE